jgi:ABC-type oligopeptide transport system substrate-binding subunit
VAWEADATGFDLGFSRGIQAYYIKGNLFNPLVTVDGVTRATAFSAFSVARKPFDDQRVRIALAGYGIDRRAIAKAALLGHGGPQWGFLPPGAKGFK